MKKTLFLTLAAVLVSATQLMATVDIYITGSTAFRANCYSACYKMFSAAPTISILAGGTYYVGTSASNSASEWCMSGTAASALTSISGSMVIHGTFTGSVQGIYSETTREGISFITPANTAITNTPTIAFSDVATESTPYSTVGSSTYSEENVAIQPFAMFKSVSPNPVMTNLNNVSFEQTRCLIEDGLCPLSAWTYNYNDGSTNIYMFNRTKDSGTRRTTYSNAQYGYNQPTTIYIYDVTNHDFYTTSSTNYAVAGGSPYGVIGTEGPGPNGDNERYLQGYIGGGDIATALKVADYTNTSVAYLSLSDGKAITGVSWQQMMPFDGVWPTVAGAGITNATSTTNINNFGPIINGSYGMWAAEVVVYPIGTFSDPEQDVTLTELGNQNASGSFLGVLDSQSLPGTPIIGSIENEILNSAPNTAIPLNEMNSSRASVGGTITPANY